MNTGDDDAPAGLDWRAIAIGAGMSLSVGFALSYLMGRIFTLGGGPPSPLLTMLWPLVGLINDALGGAIAGFLARRHGLAHGALACVLASVASTLVTIVRFANAGLLTNWDYWLRLPFWLALGIAVGAGAGALAVRAATSTPRE